MYIRLIIFIPDNFIEGNVFWSVPVYVQNNSKSFRRIFMKLDLLVHTVSRQKRLTFGWAHTCAKGSANRAKFSIEVLTRRHARAQRPNCAQWYARDMGRFPFYRNRVPRWLKTFLQHGSPRCRRTARVRLRPTKFDTVTTRWFSLVDSVIAQRADRFCNIPYFPSQIAWSGATKSGRTIIRARRMFYSSPPSICRGGALEPIFFTLQSLQYSGSRWLTGRLRPPQSKGAGRWEVAGDIIIIVFIAVG